MSTRRSLFDVGLLAWIYTKSHIYRTPSWYFNWLKFTIILILFHVYSGTRSTRIQSDSLRILYYTTHMTYGEFNYRHIYIRAFVLIRRIFPFGVDIWNIHTRFDLALLCFKQRLALINKLPFVFVWHVRACSRYIASIEIVSIFSWWSAAWLRDGVSWI